MAIAQINPVNTIDVSEIKAKLDECAKNLIRHKAVLAHILKECVDEFKAFDVEFIQNECIVDEIKTSVVAQDQDAVGFDVLFTARVPNTKKVIGVTINVEIQGDASPGYPIAARAVQYVGRLVSMQKGTVF